jgi:Ca2+-binding EF-hand superfamily protein
MRKTLAGLVAGASLVVAGFSAAQDEDLFTKLDANKDGFVTSDEVPEAQKGLFERMLRNADKDGDKKLSKAEFQLGLKPDEAPKQPLAGGQGFPGRPGAAGQGNPREFFARWDANKDGKLSKDELPPPMQENFARLDANGDGFVSEDEFGRGARGFGQRPPGAPGAGTDPSPQEIEGLFDRTDSNSDGKLTKDEVPEDRPGIRAVLERAGGESISKEQFVRGMMALAQQPGGQPGAPQRRPEGAPARRPEGAPPGAPPGGGLFGTLDTDKDGQLSTAEIAGAGAVLLKLDRNGDGKLTPDEVFGAGALPMPPRPGEGQPARPGAPGRPPGAPAAALEEIRDRIKQADTNSDGKISKEESQKATDRIRDNFDRIDTNSDGFIDEAEMRQMMQRFGAGKAKGKRPENK